MTHARIVKAQMVDWIRNCVEMDLPSPTDDEIIDKFNLTGSASARSLLADCSEEGAITVSWNAPGRPIALGPKERVPLVRAMPSTVLARKASRDVDATVKRISDIVHRKPTAIADEVAAEARESAGRRVAAARSGTTIRPGDKVKAQPSKRRLTLDQTAERVKEFLARGSAAKTPDSPPAHCARADAAKGRSLADTPPMHVEAAPQPARLEPAEPKISPPPALEMKRLPTVPLGAQRGPKYKTAAASVTIELYERLGTMAEIEGLSRSVSLLGLITEALTAREKPPAPTGKPRVRADVVKAWQGDNRSFGEFVTSLIDLGLVEHQRRLARGTGRAAE